MIILTRLDGKPVAVNEDLIVYADHTPDTVLFMSTGQRLMVKESLTEVVRRSAEYRRGSALVHGDEMSMLTAVPNEAEAHNG